MSELYYYLESLILFTLNVSEKIAMISVDEAGLIVKEQSVRKKPPKHTRFLSQGFVSERSGYENQQGKYEDYGEFLELFIDKAKELIKQQNILRVENLIVILPKRVIDDEFALLTTALRRYSNTKIIRQADYLKMIFEIKSIWKKKQEYDKEVIGNTIQRAELLLDNSMRKKDNFVQSFVPFNGQSFQGSQYIKYIPPQSQIHQSPPKYSHVRNSSADVIVNSHSSSFHAMNLPSAVVLPPFSSNNSYILQKSNYIINPTTVQYVNLKYAAPFYINYGDKLMETAKKSGNEPRAFDSMSTVKKFREHKNTEQVPSVSSFNFEKHCDFVGLETGFAKPANTDVSESEKNIIIETLEPGLLSYQKNDMPNALDAINQLPQVSNNTVEVTTEFKYTGGNLRESTEFTDPAILEMGRSVSRNSIIKKESSKMEASSPSVTQPDFEIEDTAIERKINEFKISLEENKDKTNQLVELLELKEMISQAEKKANKRSSEHKVEESMEKLKKKRELINKLEDEFFGGRSSIILGSEKREEILEKVEKVNSRSNSNAQLEIMQESRVISDIDNCTGFKQELDELKRDIERIISSKTIKGKRMSIVEVSDAKIKLTNLSAKISQQYEGLPSESVRMIKEEIESLKKRLNDAEKAEIEDDKNRRKSQSNLVDQIPASSDKTSNVNDEGVTRRRGKSVVESSNRNHNVVSKLGIPLRL